MNTPPQILIVEDDAVLATELQETLTQFGYEVSGLAATGKTAIASALTHKPDVILMDIHLRGAMTGIQAVEQIHQQLDIPVVYLTAHSDEAYLQQAKITDAYAYLVKPVRDRELRAGLEMALYKHAAEQRLQHLNQILRAVRDVNQLITREHDAQRLMDEACQILLRAHGNRFVWIGESTGDRLKPLAFAGDGQALIAHIVASATPEQGLKLPGTEASRTRRVVVCPDMRQDERYAPWREAVEQAHFSSTVAVPIFHEENLFGVLSVYSDQTSIFGAEEIDLLLEMAGDIAFGLKAIAGEAERQRAAEALRESEAKFKTLFDTANDAIFTMSHTLFLDCNATTEKIFRCSREQIIGHSPVEFSPERQPDGRLSSQSAAAKIEAAFAGQPQVFEWLHTRLDRTPFDAEVSLNRVFIGGEFILQAIVRDITGRKQAEAALRENQRFLSDLIENSGTLIYVKDLAGRYELVNKKWEETTGLKREIVLGRTDEDLFPGATGRNFRKADVQVIEQGAVLEKEETLEDATGTKFFISVKFPLRDKNNIVKGLCGVTTEITARKRAEEALRENEEKYRRLFDNAPLGIFQASLAGQIISINPAFAHMLGYDSPAEAMNNIQNVATDLFADPNRRAEIIRLMSDRPDLRTFENVYRRKDGSAFIGQLHALLIRDAEGRLVRTEGLIEDITERKQAEEKIRAALEEKEALLREVHHRVKNNLQAIIALMEMQARLIPDEGPRQFLKELEGQARTMALVYEQLYQSVNLARVQMTPYLQQLTFYVSETFGGPRAVQLHLDIAPIALDVAQAMPCGLIVNELFTNILKHAFPPDFHGQPTVHIALEYNGETYRLTVADNGVGLPPDYDWHASRSLGLRLVNLWATHQLGGTLTVRSEPGATYTITFRQAAGETS